MKGFAMLFGAVALTTACASGGGGPPQVTVAEAEAIGALFGGRWVLDESGSSPQISTPRPAAPQTFTVVVSSSGRGQIPAGVRAAAEAEAVRQAAFSVLRRRPRTLDLGVDGARLVYAPAPGSRITLPINGGSRTQYEDGEVVRTRVRWDGVKLQFEHQVRSDGLIGEVLELVGGRLQMTRTIRVAGETVAPLVLLYDREGSGAGDPANSILYLT